MKTIKFEITDQNYYMLKIYVKYGHYEKDKLFDNDSYYNFLQWTWNSVDKIKALISEDKKLLSDAFGSYNKTRLIELKKYLQTDECKEIIKIYNKYNNDKISSKKTHTT